VGLILLFSAFLASASYFAQPEDTERLRQMTMGTALIVGYSLSIYSSRFGFDLGLNTLTTVLLSPFVFATIRNRRLRYAGYVVTGLVATCMAHALNQMILADAHV
jgi:uncharacterized membrane protein YccC